MAEDKARIEQYNEAEGNGFNGTAGVARVKPTIGQRIKTHYKRWWWVHVIIVIIVVLVVTLPVYVSIFLSNSYCQDDGRLTRKAESTWDTLILLDTMSTTRP